MVSIFNPSAGQKCTWECSGSRAAPAQQLGEGLAPLWASKEGPGCGGMVPLPRGALGVVAGAETSGIIHPLISLPLQVWLWPQLCAAHPGIATHETPALKPPQTLKICLVLGCF